MLHRYIAKNVMLATLAVLAIITSLSFFIGILGELKDVGLGDYGILQAITHVMLLLPYTLYQFFPMLVLLGGVIGLSILDSHQELVAIRMAGVSLYQITTTIIIAALILILIATAMGELIAPRAKYLADTHKSTAQNGGQAVATSSGLWIHQGNNFLHIERVIDSTHLEGVTRYEFDDQHRLLTSYYVDILTYYNKQWQLHHLAKTIITGDRTSSQQLENSTWDLNLNPNLLNVGVVEPANLPLSQLATYARHLAKNGLQAGSFQFEFWKRVFQPLTTLVMILLAIPFVFSSPRSINLGWRTLFAIMVGFVFYILNAFLGQLSVVFQLSPFFAALLPILLFAMLGYALMWRSR